MISFPRRSSCPKCSSLFHRQLTFCPRDGAKLRPLPQDPLLGQVIAGAYRVERVIGDTRSRRVYEVRRGDSSAALHVLFGERAASPQAREAFEREARLAALFDHWNVLGVSDTGVTDTGLPFMITDSLECRSLEGVLREDAPFGTARVAHLVSQLCAGLAHIHLRGYVHGALSPSAVFVTLDPLEEVRIANLGFAQKIGDHLPSVTTTMAPYLPAKVIAGAPLESSDDLYSLGVLMCRMLGAESIRNAPLFAIARKLVEPPTDSHLGDAQSVQRAIRNLALSAVYSTAPER